MATQPLVVIVGPTASGKTSLSIELAKRFGGEIICADSRTVYKGMDVGTAKPTSAERAEIPHWGLDLVDPGEKFSAYDFKNYAYTKIAEIRSRGNIPFLVGGTGLYTDAVIFDYEFGNPVDQKLRDRLQEQSVEQLQEYCIKNNVLLPENVFNKRYLIRAIEQNNANGKRRVSPIANTIVVGISTDRTVLRKRIRDRAEQFFEDNVVEEALRLAEEYGWDNEAMTGNIYPLVHQYTQGELTIDEVKERFITLDWRLAKRQLTWLKRNQFIRWFSLKDARHYLTDLLANR